jgi:two-component system, chemotaxis family, response regulator Rcp1
MPNCNKDAIGRPGGTREIADDSGERHAPINVLLVEDNPGDVRLTQEAFRLVNVSIKLHLASNGVEAIEFLTRVGAHVGAPRPDLVILDLKLPKMGGHEVLARIKMDENLRTIPTIMLTNSEQEADVLTSYQLQANCHLRKPTHWDEFDSIIRCVNDFWLAKSKVRQREPME